ncbi:hypothetical protein CHARACLAT_000149, partial [Characodon lateralis]|nr:hypothetical protein [Characodon lateralis]
ASTSHKDGAKQDVSRVTETTEEQKWGLLEPEAAMASNSLFSTVTPCQQNFFWVQDHHPSASLLCSIACPRLVQIKRLKDVLQKSLLGQPQLLRTEAGCRKLAERERESGGHLTITATY